MKNKENILAGVREIFLKSGYGHKQLKEILKRTFQNYI